MWVNQLESLGIEIFLLVLALGLLIPISVLFIECIAALFPAEQSKYYEQTPRPRVAVLVPAHNETSGIAHTLNTLLPQLTDQDRLVVIADNCDDDTAIVARRSGATVIERQEPEQKGKGYALEYGLRFIAKAPPEVLIIVDADCTVHSGTIDYLARLAATISQPVQSCNLLLSSNLKDAVSALAFTVKNLVRPSGLARLGLPCWLTGTGMAFPWSVIQDASLGGNIVEDMQLAVDLAIAGYSPVLCLEAKVTGIFPQKQQAAKTQKTRWEHGHLQTLVTQLPTLFKEAIRQKRFNLLALALDLCVPPLSLLVIIWASLLGFALLAVRIGTSWNPCALLAIEGLLICISIVVAWAKFARRELPAWRLLAIPLYVLWKIPIYIAYLIQPQSTWIRAERDEIKLP